MAAYAKRKMHNQLPQKPEEQDPQVIATTKDYPPYTSAIQALIVLGMGTIMVIMRDYPLMVPQGADSAKWIFIPLAAVWALSFAVFFFQNWWEARVGRTYESVLLASCMLALMVMFTVIELSSGGVYTKCHFVHDSVLPQVCIDQMKKMWSLLLLDLAPALTFACASPFLQVFALRIIFK